MDDNENFEPFLDWSEITDDMAMDLYERVKPYKAATERLVKEGGRRRPNMQKMREATADILRHQMKLSACAEAISRTIYTVPVMIHVAGSKSVEKCPEEGHDHDAQIQRCSRCGSVLQYWRDGMVIMTPQGPHEIVEDEMDWWEPGTTIAKSGAEGPGMTMYVVEDDRELEKHEMVCVDLAELMK